MPSRLSPASASIVASTSPASSFFIRVCTLPRKDSTRRSGRRWRICAWRRRDAVPTTLPGASSSRLPAFAEMKTSLGSSLSSTAARPMPSGSQVSRSFMECTARSTRPASSASSISLVNRPLPPMSASGLSSTLSPVVLMATTSIASSSANAGSAAASRSRTSCVWASARGLPRVPIRRGEASVMAVEKVGSEWPTR